MAKDINRIITLIDACLEWAGRPWVTPIEANRLLEAAGLLRDRPNRLGLPVRRLCRGGQIPHAYQENGKNTRWRIPHS